MKWTADVSGVTIAPPTMQIIVLPVRNIPLGVQLISLTEAITGVSSARRTIPVTVMTAITIMQKGVWNARKSQRLYTITVTDPT
jgi:hypothetical protein